MREVRRLSASLLSPQPFNYTFFYFVGSSSSSSPFTRSNQSEKLAAKRQPAELEGPEPPSLPPTHCYQTVTHYYSTVEQSERILTSPSPFSHYRLGFFCVSVSSIK